MVTRIRMHGLLFSLMNLRDVQVYIIYDENVPEIWREFVGYDLDLSLTPVISSPDVLVSNGNNDNLELVDGNLATCIQLNQTWCNVPMKVESSCLEQLSIVFLSLVALINIQWRIQDSPRWS